MNREVKTNSIKYNYLIIPIITIGVIIINWFLTKFAMQWYVTLRLPFLMPSSKTISIFWLLTYILTTIAALLVWNTFKRSFRFWAMVFFFIVNVLLNITWHYLFFYQHLLGMASVEMVSLALSVLVLILLIQPISLSTALLLYPYLLWTSFVTYLNYMIWLIN